MALVTYILLSALHSGLSARFNPTVFGASASRALGVVLLDFLFVKMGCYVLGVQQGAVGGSADLVAYGGYKFVG
jgi:protein transport protein YIF1